MSDNKVPPRTKAQAEARQQAAALQARLQEAEAERTALAERLAALEGEVSKADADAAEAVVYAQKHGYSDIEFAAKKLREEKEPNKAKDPDSMSRNEFLKYRMRVHGF